MSREEYVINDPQAKQATSYEETRMKMLERYADEWEAEERRVDLAAALMAFLGKKELSVQDSFKILEKAKNTLEQVVQSTHWGDTLLLHGTIPFITPYSSLYNEAVAAILKRRKEQRDQANTVPTSESTSENDGNARNSEYEVVQLLLQDILDMISKSPAWRDNLTVERRDDLNLIRHKINTVLSHIKK